MRNDALLFFCYGISALTEVVYVQYEIIIIVFSNDSRGGDESAPWFSKKFKQLSILLNEKEIYQKEEIEWIQMRNEK